MAGSGANGVTEGNGSPTIGEIGRNQHAMSIQITELATKIDGLMRMAIERRFEEQDRRLVELERARREEIKTRGATLRQVMFVVLAAVLAIVGSVIAGIMLGQ